MYDYQEIYGITSVNSHFSLRAAKNAKYLQSQMVPRKLCPIFLKRGGDVLATRGVHQKDMQTAAKKAAGNTGLNVFMAGKIAGNHDMGHGFLGHRKEIVFAGLQENTGIKFMPFMLRHEPNLINLNDKFGWGLDSVIVREASLHAGERRQRVISPGQLEKYVTIGKEFKTIINTNCRLVHPYTYEGCVVKMLDSGLHIPSDNRDLKLMGILDEMGYGTISIPTKTEIVQDLSENSLITDNKEEGFVAFSNQMFEKLNQLLAIKEEFFELPEMISMRATEDELIKILVDEIVRGVMDPEYRRNAVEKNIGLHCKLELLLKIVKYDTSQDYHPYEVASDFLSFLSEDEGFRFYFQLCDWKGKKAIVSMY